jgi:CspA family cold shock protein
VKFFRAEKGWGAITSPDLDHDVWIHFAFIDKQGTRNFAAGDEVEFTHEECWGLQDSWHYRATWAKQVVDAQ